MQARRLGLIAVVVAVAMTGRAAPAVAHSPYDGRWRVTIRSRAGHCKAAAGHYTLSIHDGLVSYRGLMPVWVRGAVDRQGRVRVSLSGGTQRAYAAGRLFGNRGIGSWRGRSRQGLCAGLWWAQRR